MDFRERKEIRQKYPIMYSIILCYFVDPSLSEILFSALFFVECRIKYKTDIYLAQYLFSLMWNKLDFKLHKWSDAK